MEVATAPEGLRASKKRRTRDAIAGAAMRLFRERGFDAVTVAEVAAAADVSEKTVFNYFPAKEDLVLERGQDRRAALIAAIRERPAGASVVEPFREASLAFLDRVEHDPVETTVAVPRLVMASPTLRDRLFVGWEREAEQLSPVIAAAAGADDDDLTARVVARSLAWTNRLVFRAAVTRLIAGEDRRVVASDLRADARRAYRQLEQGLAGYGERRG
jgi:AcrR family transcriptional regulator